MPCLLGEIHVPDWAISLVESDPSPWTIMRLAQVITGEAPDKEARNAAIRESWAAGGVSQYELAEQWGLQRTAVQSILGAGHHVRNGSKEKAAVGSGPQ